MGKTLIRVDCVDQRLFVTSPQSIASGGRNEDIVEFNFCPLWDGYAKTAVFYRSENDVYHAVLSGNQCIIPHEVLVSDGWMYFGVFGTKGDTTRTSEVIRYRVVKGALTTGTKPSDPTPDIYAQIMSQLADVESFVKPSEPFSITGDLVKIDNYEGMPMDCVTRIEPIQQGSGDPAPDNIRPISGRTGAELTLSGPESDGKTFTLDFGSTVYGGTLDWNKGLLTVDRALLTLDGTEAWQFLTDRNSRRFAISVNALKAYNDASMHICSHLSLSPYGGILTAMPFGYYYMTSAWITIYDEYGVIATLDDWKAYLAEQYAAGTPVQMCYRLENPTTIQLTPQNILALQGLNHIWSDVGETTVSGRKDVLWMAGYLPTATAQTKGGVMVGKGLRMDGDVLGVDEGEGYKLIKEITLTAEQAGITQIVETFPAPGYDGIIMTVEKSAPPNTVSAFAGFGESTVKRATGGDLFWAGTNTGAKYVCYNMGGAWETYLHQGAAGDKSSMRGAVSSTNVSLVGADFNYIGYVRLYTFDAGGFPAGMNVKIYGKAATR